MGQQETQYNLLLMVWNELDKAKDLPLRDRVKAQKEILDSVTITRKQETFTKDQVIDLLRQQRELCAKVPGIGLDWLPSSAILNAPSPLK